MDNERQVSILNIDDIIPNRFQPRIKFNEQAINELSESIKRHGVIQPIVVRKISDKYEIIAGERRYKASVLAGKTTIPAIITNLDDKNSAEVALMENVQRQDLTPIEEAISYKKILDMGYINQGELGEKLGKKQSTIANKLRLLNLNDEVQEALMENKISERHARSLLKLDEKSQILMLNRIIEERLTVRKTDEEINKLLNSNQIKEDNKGEDKMNDKEILNEFNIPTEPIINPQEENNQSNIEVSPLFSNEPVESIKPDIDNTQSLEPLQNNQTFTSIPTEPIIEEFNPFENNMSDSINIDNISSIQNDTFVNPGFMDIDKIQDEAKDIKVEPTPVADMDNLLKPDVELQPVNEQVTSPLEDVMGPSQPLTGKFFSLNDINSNQGTFVNDIEEQSVNMDFGEPKIERSINPINLDLPTFENNNEESSDSDNGTTLFTQPLESTKLDSDNIQSSEPLQNNQTFTSIPTEPIVEVQSEPIELPTTPVESEENFFDFSSPVNAVPLNDDAQFGTNENIYENQVNRSYMMDESVTFDEDGEIEVKVPNQNEKYVAVDMKTVINTIRDCATTIEKFGYKIDTDEIDLADSYEVTFRIYKN